MATSSRPRRPSREERRDAVRGRLLEALVRMTAEGETIAQVSVERLAKEAGISRATFYIYFEDKGDLLRARFEQVGDEFIHAWSTWCALDPPAGRKDLRAAIGALAAAATAHASVLAAVYTEATRDPTMRRLVADLLDRAVATLSDGIELGSRKGWIDANLSPRETATWLIWMLERGLTEVIPRRSGREANRLVDAYTDILWQVLYSGQ